LTSPALRLEGGGVDGPAFVYDAIGRHLALSGYGALAPASSPKVVSSQQQDILSVDLLASVCSLVDRPELGTIERTTCGM